VKSQPASSVELKKDDSFRNWLLWIIMNHKMLNESVYIDGDYIRCVS